ncbi:hypothetical protein ALC56_12472 [Trachymyrmex septentrionalis]|uniref:Uncharacterized protein n=1 Tax=Trachymyrmex septentrionalis TaxID=34720 RepID=A0A195EZ33_9HYME|nr:hypothetical protein ALC56_12472 [Trachymyrmex septentrionalis]
MHFSRSSEVLYFHIDVVSVHTDSHTDLKRHVVASWAIYTEYKASRQAESRMYRCREREPDGGRTWRFRVKRETQKNEGRVGGWRGISRREMATIENIAEERMNEWHGKTAEVAVVRWWREDRSVDSCALALIIKPPSVFDGH